MNPEWYHIAFGELYPLIYPHRSDDAARQELDALLRWFPVPSGARILDVCCGAGRHLDALLSHGYDAWGLDLSGFLLHEAIKRPRLRHRLIRSDIRTLPFRSRFDIVMNLFSSFGYFHEEDDNQHALDAMVSVLKPHGRLVIDHIHRPYLERNLVPETRTERDGWRVTQHRSISGNYVIKQIEATQNHHPPVMIEERVRIYLPEEFHTMLQKAGCDSIQWWSGFDGAPLTPESPRMLITARRSTPGRCRDAVLEPSAAKGI